MLHFKREGVLIANGRRAEVIARSASVQSRQDISQLPQTTVTVSATAISWKTQAQCRHGLDKIPAREFQILTF
jgi:hypothetical protein